MKTNKQNLELYKLYGFGKVDDISSTVFLSHIVFDEYPSDEYDGSYLKKEIEDINKVFNDDIVKNIFKHFDDGENLMNTYKSIIDKSIKFHDLSNPKIVTIDELRIDKFNGNDTTDIMEKYYSNIYETIDKLIDEDLITEKDIKYVYGGFCTPRIYGKPQLHAIGIVYQKFNDPTYPYLLTISNSGNGVSYQGIIDNNGMSNAIMQFKVTREQLHKFLSYVIAFRDIMSVEYFYVHLLSSLFAETNMDFLENSKQLHRIIHRKMQLIGNCATLSVLTPLVLLTDDNTEEISEKYIKIYNSLKLYGIYLKLNNKYNYLEQNTSRIYKDYVEFFKLAENFYLFEKDKLIITENIKMYIDLCKELIEKINNIYFDDVEQNIKTFDNEKFDDTKCSIKNNNIFENTDVDYDMLRKKIYDDYTELLDKYEKIKNNQDYDSLINQLENIAHMSIIIYKFINTFDDYIGCLYKLYNLCIHINELREKIDDFVQNIKEEEINKLSIEKPHHLRLNKMIIDILINVNAVINIIIEYNSNDVDKFTDRDNTVNNDYIFYTIKLNLVFISGMFMKLFYNNETKNDDFEKYKLDIKLKIYNDLMNISIYNKTEINIIKSLIVSLDNNYKWILGNELYLNKGRANIENDELIQKVERVPFCLLRSVKKDYIFGVDIPFIVKDMTKDYLLKSKIKIDFDNKIDDNTPITCTQIDKLIKFDKFKPILKPFLLNITKENTEEIITDFLEINDISVICLKTNLVLNNDTNSINIRFINITNDASCKKKIIECDFGATCKSSRNIGAGCTYDDMLLYDLKKTSTYHICSIFEDIYKNKNTLKNHIFALNYNISHKTFIFESSNLETPPNITSLYSYNLLTSLDDKFGNDTNIKLSENISSDIFFKYLTYNYDLIKSNLFKNENYANFIRCIIFFDTILDKIEEKELNILFEINKIINHPVLIFILSNYGKLVMTDLDKINLLNLLDKNIKFAKSNPLNFKYFLNLIFGNIYYFTKNFNFCTDIKLNHTWKYFAIDSKMIDNIDNNLKIDLEPHFLDPESDEPFFKKESSETPKKEENTSNIQYWDYGINWENNKIKLSSKFVQNTIEYSLRITDKKLKTSNGYINIFLFNIDQYLRVDFTNKYIYTTNYFIFEFLPFKNHLYDYYILYSITFKNINNICVKTQTKQIFNDEDDSMIQYKFRTDYTSLNVIKYVKTTESTYTSKINNFDIFLHTEHDNYNLNISINDAQYKLLRLCELVTNQNMFNIYQSLLMCINTNLDERSYEFVLIIKKFIEPDSFNEIIPFKNENEYIFLVPSLNVYFKYYNDKLTFIDNGKIYNVLYNEPCLYMINRFVYGTDLLVLQDNNNYYYLGSTEKNKELFKIQYIPTLIFTNSLINMLYFAKLLLNIEKYYEADIILARVNELSKTYKSNTIYSFNLSKIKHKIKNDHNPINKIYNDFFINLIYTLCNTIKNIELFLDNQPIPPKENYNINILEYVKKMKFLNSFEDNNIMITKSIKHIFTSKFNKNLKKLLYEIQREKETKEIQPYYLSDIDRIKSLYSIELRPLYKRILYDYIECNFNQQKKTHEYLRLHNLLMCYKQGQNETDKDSYIYYENSNENYKREILTIINNNSIFDEIEFKNESFVELGDFEGIVESNNPIKSMDLSIPNFEKELTDYTNFIKDKMTRSITLQKDTLNNIINRLKDKKNKYYKDIDEDIKKSIIQKYFRYDIPIEIIFNVDYKYYNKIMYIMKLIITINLLETLLTDTTIDIFDITHIYDDYYSQNAIFMPEFVSNNKIKTGLLNFCYLFGYNLRHKQLELAFNLHDELMINKSNFHQLLMGEGKSSVVAPVLTILLKYSDKKRIFHVMPESLIPQAIQNFNRIFYYLKNLKIHTTKDNKYNIQNNDIHIISDSYLKKNKLIKGYIEEFKNIISESTFIYDEIDEIADPLKSQYNILTDNSKLVENRDIIFKIIHDFIYNLYFSSEYASARDILMTKGFSKRTHIFREYDNTDEIQQILLSIYYNTIKSNLNEEFLNNYIYLLNKETDKINESNLYLLNQIYNFGKIIPLIVKQIHKNHFGLKYNDMDDISILFDKKNNLITDIDELKKIYTAVPYVAVDTPSHKSEFSDYLYTSALTVLSYYDTDNDKINRIRNVDIYIYLEYINELYKKNKFMPITLNIGLKLFIELTKGLSNIVYN